VENIVEDISRLVQEARLDEVIAEDKIEVLVSHWTGAFQWRPGRTG
jgi:hypothetical protein